MFVIFPQPEPETFKTESGVFLLVDWMGIITSSQVVMRKTGKANLAL